MISVAWPLIDRRADDARRVAADLDVELVLDDVDDLVDHEAHGAPAIGEHEQRLRAFRSARALRR